MADQRHPRTTEPGTPARDDREVVREERVVHDRGRRGGLSSLLGGAAKAGLWMIVGAIVAAIVLVALVLGLIF